ncbi:MAG TPA: hypothetical protein P5562_02285 [Candidatus Woesebacteria bacterium]|nr:hypothetical protein [Candidatus Woesebacteria bacterium]
MTIEKGSISAKAISAGVSLALSLGIATHSKEAKADDTLKQLNPITTALDMYRGNHWNQSVIADYLDVLQLEDKDKYLYLGIPNYIGLAGDASLPENADLHHKIYDVKTVPTWIINGILYRYSKDTAGLQLIPEGISTVKQYARFEIGSEKENVYTLKITGTNEELNKRANINLNLIVFKNEVNCTNNQDLFRTTTLKRVAYKYPLGALGERIKVENGQIVVRNLGLINIPKAIQNQCQMVAFLQDMKTKEILAAGFTEMVDGETALFNWDDLPECTLENVQDVLNVKGVDWAGLELKNSPQYLDKTGLKEKVFYVQKAKDLKYLSLQLDYTLDEAQIYQVLAAGLSPELKDKAIFKYDPKKNQVDITFTEPINGDRKLFSVFIKINKPTVDGIKDEKSFAVNKIINSVNFKMRNFYANDSQNNSLKYQLREQKNYFPVRMCTIENPFDLKKNANIDKEDLDLLLTVFGSREGDKDWQPEYDVYKEGVSQGRIDIADVTAIIKEIKEQDKLREAIKAANPQAKLPELDIQIEKIMPPFQLTKNEEINEQTIGRWLEKRQAYQEILANVKTLFKVKLN